MFYLFKGNDANDIGSWLYSGSSHWLCHISGKVVISNLYLVNTNYKWKLPQDLIVICSSL